MSSTTIKIPMRNGDHLVVETNYWASEYPEEICVYIEKNNIIWQDIAIVREHTQNDGVEVLVYANENNEDYTHKFEIKEYVDEEN